MTKLLCVIAPLGNNSASPVGSIVRSHVTIISTSLLFVGSKLEELISSKEDPVQQEGQSRLILSPEIYREIYIIEKFVALLLQLTSTLKLAGDKTGE